MHGPRNDRGRWNSAVSDDARANLKSAVAAWYGARSLSRDAFRSHRQDGTPAVRYRKPGDRRSRPERENLQGSATAEALQAVCELDLSNLQEVAPPRGFGRD